MADFVRIKTSESRYGGNIYERYIADALKPLGSYEEINPVPHIKGRWRYLGVFGFLIHLCRIARRRDDRVHIRALETAFCLNPHVINIVIAHHYDPTGSGVATRVMQHIAYRMLLWQKKRVDRLVVVSRYWYDFFRAKGFQNVTIIHNPFEIEAFEATAEAVADFKRRYGLDGKPIVYLGNAQRKKGVREAYEALRDTDVHLVTSGTRQVQLPVRHLDLSFRDYVLLLHASDVVVTMSRFKEGWNRTAHEAMLCGTPVVGSGSGGMRELLEGGGQIVCDSFERLASCVKQAMEDKTLGQKGYRFAVAFDKSRFVRAWQTLIKEL